MICLKNCKDIIKQLKKANEDLAHENMNLSKLVHDNGRVFDESVCRWKKEREELLKKISDAEDTIKVANKLHLDNLMQKREEAKKNRVKSVAPSL